MIIRRESNKRGYTKTDWLHSHHSFSFADYDDKNWMSFGSLRVLNEDWIQPEQGFGMHPHRDMEIITYVIHGAIEHHDSMNNEAIIRPREIQRMSAGTGVRHSEFNPSSTEHVHLLQIWILPEQKGISPSYEQKKIHEERNTLVLIGSREPTLQAVKIHQSIQVYAGYFDKNTPFSYPLNHQRAWLQLVKGQLQCNEHTIYAGDGMAIEHETVLAFDCVEEAEFLFFLM